MKNINFKYILLLSIIIIFNISCNSLMQVERQKDFSMKPSKINEIVSINPIFQTLKVSNKGKSKKSSTYSEKVKQERTFNDILKTNAKKNGIVLQIVDADELQTTDAEYFEYLAPLRKEILKVNSIKEFKDVNTVPAKEKSTEIFYEKGPKISSHYSHLAELYGTPFFAIQGVSYKTNENNELDETSPNGYVPNFLAEKETVYFTLIADVTRSEIVYREYRQVNSEANESNLNSIIYDSFRIIAN